MDRRRRPWWRWLLGGGRRGQGRTSAAADGPPRRAEAAPEALQQSVSSLRRLLRAERARLRPDTWRLCWTMVEHTAELLPQWSALATVRSAEALAVEEAVGRHLPARVDAFLAIPDSQKPAAADELLEQLEEVHAGWGKAVRRLQAVPRIRLESLRGLHEQ